MSQVDIPVTPDGRDTPEHRQAMIDKTIQAQAGKEGEGAEAKLLAGKFKTEDELQKGLVNLIQKTQLKEGQSLEDYYKGLESTLGSKEASSQGVVEKDSQDETQVSKQESTDSTEGQKGSQEAAETVLEKAGLDYGKYSAEFMEHGKLSEGTYTELTKAGIPKEVVDAHIAGLQLQAEQAKQNIFQITQGEENYSGMIQWAVQNLNDVKKSAFNDALASGDQGRIELAVSGLYSQYAKTISKESSLVKGDVPTSGASGYESWAQVKLDMSKPEYSKDPSFRARVQAKLQKSKF
jgi:hypothetical protein